MKEKKSYFSSDTNKADESSNISEYEGPLPQYIENKEDIHVLVPGDIVDTESASYEFKGLMAISCETRGRLLVLLQRDGLGKIKKISMPIEKAMPVEGRLRIAPNQIAIYMINSSDWQNYETYRKELAQAGMEEDFEKPFGGKTRIPMTELN